jgi:signal transduction histidine kinase
MEKKSENIKPKIIIVDDEPLILQLVYEALEETCEIFCAHTPHEVLKIIKTHEFDILITDYMMPEIRGTTLIKEARIICPNILTIVMTGQANKEIALEALRNGAYDIIEKPIFPEMLNAAIMRAWENIIASKKNKVLTEEISRYNEKLEENNNKLKLKNDTLLTTQLALKEKNIALEIQFDELKKAQSEIHRSALKAGMAEVAINILHNVGNILNSVNVSTNFLIENNINSKREILFNLIDLLKENEKDIANFLSKDKKGLLIPKLLSELKISMSNENKLVLNELRRLATNIDHIKTIISHQQNYVSQPLFKEECRLNELIEEAITILMAELSISSIKINFIKKHNPTLHISKHKLLHIMINLIRNARDALLESKTIAKEINITVSINPIKIIVEDNGIGIKPENISKIFAHGFTTKKSGHGFGLHSCALAISELGCNISVESDGFNKGARFIITFPN